MKTTITVMMSETEKEKLFRILEELHLTIDEIVEQFLQWVVNSPEEAEKWLKSKMEV